MSVVRALGPAIHPALHAAIGHRRHVGLAQADGAGSTQAFDGERIAVGDQFGKGRAAGSSGEPFDQVAVFGRVGDAIERPEGFAPGPAGIRGLGLLECFGVAHHHGIECSGRSGTVIGIDTGKIGLNQLDRGGLAGFERRAQLGNGNFGHFDHAFITDG
ncbi:hypothetical protein D3C81_1415490 [compost metagenome]